MKLNKPAKIVLGILTFLPLIFGIGFFIVAVFQILSMMFSEDPAMPLMLFSYMSYVLPYLFLLLPIYLGLGIYYLVHIIQNNYFDSEKRLLWIVILFILHAIAMAVYWYVHIWRDHSSDNSNPDTPIKSHYEPGTESQKF
jgi:flagellar basal body-associated protein FliL